MSTLNPYSTFLDDRPVLDILAETPRTVRALLDSLGTAKAYEAPAPGKWSPGEVVAHLADCELVFGFRLRQTLAENGPTIQRFDQEKWAATYKGVEPAEACAAFSAFRKWNLILLESALPTAAN